MGDDLAAPEGYEKTFGYERRFERAVLAYGAFSIAIALLGPILVPGDESFWRFSSQTIDSLAGIGGNRLDLSRYFTLMLVAFPVFLVLFVRAYPPWAMPAHRPTASSLRLFAAYVVLWMVFVFLGYLVFFLSPEIYLYGRRVRGVMGFAAHFDIGLGIVFGAIFVVAAMLAWLHIGLLAWLWKASGTRHR